MPVAILSDLRNRVLDVIKIKPNTDPTKTQGVRLQPLIMDILDTTMDSIAKLRTEMMNAINSIVIPVLPDFATFALKTDIPVVPTIPTYDFTIYALKKDIPTIPTYDFSIYAKKSDIPSIPTYDLSIYALKTQIPTIPTYDFSNYQLKTDSIPYSRLTGVPSQDLSLYRLKTDTIDYTTLTNKPTIPTYDLSIYQKKSDVVVYDLTPYQKKSDVITYDLTPYLLKTQAVTSYTQLTDKPTIVTSYLNLTDKPTIITSYTSLTDKPTIPAAQINSDWNSTSGLSQIVNKPTLFNGDYNSLTNKPLLFDGTWGSLTGKPTLVTSYSQLTGLPTLFNGVYSSLTSIPTTFTPATHSHVIGDITGLQVALDAKQNTTDNIPYTRLTGTPTIPLNKRTYTTSGELTTQIIKEYATNIVATGSGQVIDLSTVGFTTILSTQLTIESNSTDPLSIPLASIKTISPTQLVLNFLVSNSTTVSVLGALVTGLKLATTLTGVKVHILIKGY